MVTFDRAAFERSLIEQIRANGGEVTSGPFAGRRLLLLTTTGARTGEARLRPLVYSRDGDRYVIVASKGGSDANPAWYANLVANPEVSVEAGGEVFAARATPLPSGPERDRLYAQHAAEFPTFLEYAAKTARIIPVVVLERVR